MLDRETLVSRNQRLAEAFRRPWAIHRLRDFLLSAIAKVPVIRAGPESERLLIIRPDHLGDVLLCTPAIQALKRMRPKTSIHVLCGEWSAEVLANYSEIDRVLTLPFPGFERSGASSPDPWLLAWRTARMLRAIGYGSVIVMRPDHWWGALVAHLAGIGQRVGYDISNVAPFLTLACEFAHCHAVEQNMKLAETWMGETIRGDFELQIPLQAMDREYVEQTLSDRNIPNDKDVICIHPGSGAASKIWSVQKYAQAADLLAGQFEAAIVFTGTASESELASEIADRMEQDSHVCVGATTVGQLAALYERSLAVLGPDSGAMHLAASVHTPTVTLFGPADPVEFAPWGDVCRHAVVTSDIACRPCRILDWRNDNPAYHPCVSDITVGQVMEAASRVISAKS